MTDRLYEEWRFVPSLPGYEISSLGNARGPRGIRKLKICKRGYHWLSVANGRGSATNISVARLVCEAFNGPPPNAGMDCDHINRERGDNRPCNLRWATREENLTNRVCQRGSRHSHAKLTESDVRAIRATPYRRGLDSEMARTLHVSRETVRDVRLGKYWSHVQ